MKVKGIVMVICAVLLVSVVPVSAKRLIVRERAREGEKKFIKETVYTFTLPQANTLTKQDTENVFDIISQDFENRA